MVSLCLTGRGESDGIHPRRVGESKSMFENVSRGVSFVLLVMVVNKQFEMVVIA
jgi:hypothetical protein